MHTAVTQTQRCFIYLLALVFAFPMEAYVLDLTLQYLRLQSYLASSLSIMYPTGNKIVITRIPLFYEAGMVSKSAMELLQKYFCC